MSNVSHVSTVDKGLKMKIKRTKVGPASGKADPKHEVVKTDANSAVSTPQSSSCGSHTSMNGVVATGGSGARSLSPDSKSSNGGAASNTPTKTSCVITGELGKEKSPKVKSPYVKKDKSGKDKSAASAVSKLGDGTSLHVTNGGTVTTAAGGSSGISTMGCVSNGLDVLFSQVSMEPRVAVEAVPLNAKRELPRPVLDPYEFNAKVEDGIGLPLKKLKAEAKAETASSPMQLLQYNDAATETCSVGVVTEPDCLGPCEPGTSVNLEGIVWQETDTGVLVVNVTWRGKTYVGTLLDATKHDWAPPRPNCESPVSDFETRTPKGRGKRGRTGTGTPVSERSIPEGRKLRKGRRGSNTNFQAPPSPARQAPPSPARSDTSSAGVKRKGRQLEDQESKGDKGCSSKRSRSCSRGGGTESPTPSTVIECPEPNCNKKYKHINGLRYHQTHAHHHPHPVPDDEKDEEEEMDTDKDSNSKKESLSERAERMKAKEQRQREKEREQSLEKDCSSFEDNIPLKAFTSRTGSQSAEKSKPEISKSEVKVTESSKTETSVVVAPVTTSPPFSAVVTSKKKDGPCVSVGMSVSKTGTSGQVYQISGVGCLGSMTVISSNNTVQAPIITPALAVTAGGISVPITMAPLSTANQDSNKGETKDNKIADKPKGKVMARPIVPAPTHQMMALTTNPPSSQGSSSSGLTQATSSLKMIQPKPTIMGEYSGLNPALVDLKEKRSKTKKKKDKDAIPGSIQTASSGTHVLKLGSKEELNKCDRPNVIKRVTSPQPGRSSLDVMSRKDGIPSIEVSKPTDSPKATASSSLTLSSPVGSPLIGLKGQPQEQGRAVQPPGLLKVDLPLHVNSNERKSPINDDVQSPAYSDISDANDSSSPHQQDTPKKDGDNVGVKKDETPTGPPAAENSGVPHYGMYYYGRQAPFLSTNVSAGPQTSPNSAASQKKDVTARSEEGRPASNLDEIRKSGMDKQEEKESTATAKIPSGSKSEAVAPGNIPPPSQQHQQQQMQEYQQKWLQQFYSQIRMLPQQAQYQYLAAYGMLEPYHQMHYASQQDQQYRQGEKISEEQKRLQEPGGKKVEGEAGKKLSGSRPPSAEQGTSNNELNSSSTNQKFSQPVYVSHATANERTFESRQAAEERELKEQALREKQNENHKILKENIELKSQMDCGRKEFQKQEEYRRLQLFQQQKLLEQQRSAEKRKLEGSAKLPELTSAGRSVESRLNSQACVLKPEDIKKEPLDASRLKDVPSRPSDPKTDDKKFSSDKVRNNLSSMPNKSKPRDSPSSTNNSITLLAPSSTQTGPSNQYSAYPYPGLYPPYGPVQVDPNHPMYRTLNHHMIGFAPAPTSMYLHHSQLGYRMGPMDAIEKDVSKSDGKSSAPSPGVDGAKGTPEGAGSQYYSGPVHKIHELQEKARSRPDSVSPAPTKPGDVSTSPSAVGAGVSDKQREYSKSPPTQRHLHTHHHTHVLSHGFPVPYPDPYSAMLAAASQSHGTAPPPPSLQPSFTK